MKLKHVFSSLALAAIASAGLVAGLQPSRGAEKAEAASPTAVYLKWTGTTWSGWDGAFERLGVHFFDSSHGDHGYAGWEDKEASDALMVSNNWKIGDDYYFKFNVPTDATYTYDKLIFHLIGWGGSNDQTENLTLPTNDENVFIINGQNDYNNFKGYWTHYDLDITDGYYLRGDWGTSGQSNYGWSVSGQKAMTLSDGVATYSNLPLDQWGKVKLVKYENHLLTTWVVPSSVSPAQSAGEAFYVALTDDSDKNAYVSEDGVYTIAYTVATGALDFTGGSSADYSAAETFATTFVTDMLASCPVSGGTSSTVATAWGQKITAYSELDEGVQFFLLEKVSSSKHIEAFHESYDYIYGHYATVRALTGADFLGRNPQVKTSWAPIPTITSASNTTVIIIAISAIALVAIGGYILFRKKKEN